MRSLLARPLLRSTMVAVAACGALSGVGLRCVVRADQPISPAAQNMAGLEATSARDARVGSARARLALINRLAAQSTELAEDVRHRAGHHRRTVRL